MADAEPVLTPEDAQALHDQEQAAGRWLIWMVGTDQVHPDRIVAWGTTADPSGGTRQPGELVADTLDELRAMLPAGLTRRDRTSVMPPSVVETWD